VGGGRGKGEKAKGSRVGKGYVQCYDAIGWVSVHCAAQTNTQTHKSENCSQ